MQGGRCDGYCPNNAGPQKSVISYTTLPHDRKSWELLLIYLKNILLLLLLLVYLLLVYFCLFIIIFLFICN